MVVVAVEEPCMLISIAIAARVAPTAALFFKKLPIALKKLNLGISSLHLTAFSSTRRVVFLSMNWKAKKPIIPITNAIQIKRSPMSVFPSAS